jgi:hypothetical protein
MWAGWTTRDPAAVSTPGGRTPETAAKGGNRTDAGAAEQRQFPDGADVPSSCSNFSQGSTWKAEFELMRLRLLRPEILQNWPFDQVAGTFALVHGGRRIKPLRGIGAFGWRSEFTSALCFV